MASFVLEHGSYKLDVPCPACKATDRWDCYPGDWPKCWNCGVKVLLFGRTPSAPCVTPNGRIDSHMAYAEVVNGKWRCSFCKKVAKEKKG